MTEAKEQFVKRLKSRAKEFNEMKHLIMGYVDTVKENNIYYEGIIERYDKLIEEFLNRAREMEIGP